MTLTQVEARSGQGALLPLPLGDISEGYSVRDITGLDPVPATIVSTSYATQDGEQYHSSRREKRNIVLTLGLEPDYSTESARKLRDRLYSIFMPKSEVALTFISDDEPAVNISGRIESFEAPLFTANPQATISVVCFDPDFVDPTPIRVSGNSVSNLTPTNLEYDGTVETGFVFRLLVNRAITQFSIVNMPSDNMTRSMDFDVTLQPGDIVEVSTVPGSKGVYLIRGTTRSSMLYSLSPYSDWIFLYPGSNAFTISAAGAQIPFILDYTNRYGGL